MTGEDGFTLIELLIVIIVLGILAAIVVFALNGVTSQSAVAACNSDAKTVSIAVSADEAQNPGATPTTLNALVTGGYLKSVPTNPNYAILLDPSGNVMVALVTGTTGDSTATAAGVISPAATAIASSVDPGAGWLTGSPAAVIGATAEQYEGTHAFAWTTAGHVGQGICAGA